MVCVNRALSWNIMGEFIDSLLEQHNTKPASMDIYMYPINKNVGTFGNIVLDEVIRDLDILGFNLQPSRDNSLHFQVTSQRETFEAELYYNCTPKITFTSDNISLSAAGITTKRMADDRLNMNNGLATLDRLIDHKCKKSTLVRNYFNINNNFVLRLENAQMIQQQMKLMNNGFNLHGHVIKSRGADGSVECPICFESQGVHFTTLKCSHAFCMQCLAKHISKEDDSNGRCPLCRECIVFDI